MRAFDAYAIEYLSIPDDKIIILGVRFNMAEIFV